MKWLNKTDLLVGQHPNEEDKVVIFRHVGWLNQEHGFFYTLSNESDIFVSAGDVIRPVYIQVRFEKGSFNG